MPRSPGRATAAGAGILSPVTSIEGDPELWPFLRGCGVHYPGLLERLAGDGVDVSGAGYGRCGLLSVSLRPHEDDGTARSPRWSSGVARQACRDLAGGGLGILPAAGSGPPGAPRPERGPGRRAGHGGRGPGRRRGAGRRPSSPAP